MRHLVLTAVLSCIGLPVVAACPAAQDIQPQMQSLIAQTQAAPNQQEGRRLSGEMWQLWLQAPDEAAQQALDRGMERRNLSDFVGALAAFDRLTAYCPDYAEGFNQRAYLYFLTGQHDKALVDLDIALKLQPLHIAALAGRALTLMNLGRLDEAREQMLAAVAMNPWLSERALLAEGAPLGPKGKDI